MAKDGAKAVMVSGIVDDKVLVKPVPGASTHVNKGFQSEAAMAKANLPSDEDDGEVRSAEIAPVQHDPAVESTADYARLVKVRSREYIPPFRYGAKMFELHANKEHLIPLHVRQHLEEKGLL